MFGAGWDREKTETFAPYLILFPKNYTECNKNHLVIDIFISLSKMSNITLALRDTISNTLSLSPRTRNIGYIMNYLLDTRMDRDK